MLAIVGIVVVFAMVFGGYLLAGGKFGIIAKALPFELMMIGGAAAGTFLVANNASVVKGTLADLKYVFSGPKWTRNDYRDLLSLMFMIVKTLKTKGVLALEPHLERPQESSLFSKFPKIQQDHFALPFIADTLRMMTMSMDDPYQVEDCMQRQLKKHHAELHARAAAIRTVADALPALGIVAAVLGVVKTMASINEPVEILGKMIGGALVGTFLGVFLAYGFFGPFASKLDQVYRQDGQFYAIIRDCLVAYLQGHSAPVAVELARGNVPSELQPTFQELDELLAAIPTDPLAG
ncbi:MAG: flagellar motor stator protein MotA [Geminicoccaceae bacterium]|nr:flagellar motor stator protein MotA [Geminicoccaceae bacterium]MCS7266876.1 flagellar motor stator protein MotA [Geminicoccaceae bacterium]MCX7628860.1 flagellar motor stator protein MotA [Geminicoccaceae bacterium]MDW8124201.1 flagellar motor stator protein MotA [Geminicoccaceae bacterium]MDW8340576.1 flagellar motor stator protein MotA [Geminicoccaceae bacterium]